ncbi:MAG: HAMP domain-containing sensor histidine kinase [Patescibacteria group bacterium]
MIISVFFSIALYNISSNELGRGLGKQAMVFRDIPDNTFIQRKMIDLEKLRQDQIKESNHILQLNLLWFNLLILVLSSAVGYLLARKTLQPIEEAMEAQNNFTADASHELRTPLTAMKTEIEVNLRDKSLTLEASKELLKSNLEEIGKLESLSNALLKLARSEGDETDKFEKINLDDAIRESVKKISISAKDKGIDIVIDYGPLVVRGITHSLEELFIILLDNAVKYSSNGSTINIKMAKDKENAVVWIKDQGIGIKPRELPYIFNRFYRSDSSRSKKMVDGYGLGLAIAKHIVEIHNGEISVESTPGEGSEFMIKLPTA